MLSDFHQSGDHRIVSDWPAMTSSSMTSWPNLHALVSDWPGAGAGTCEPPELKAAARLGRRLVELDGWLPLDEECGGIPLNS